MACSCNKTATTKKVTFVVTLPGGVKKSYSSEVEAAAAAQRGGGTYKAA